MCAARKLNGTGYLDLRKEPDVTNRGASEKCDPRTIRVMGMEFPPQ